MEILGKTLNGAVVVNRNNSHLHDNVKPIIKKVLAAVHTNDRDFFDCEVHFQEIIGFSCCVKTSPADCIIFAKRPNRSGYTRFVLDRDLSPTSTVVVVLKKIKPLEYVLITAYVGEKAELEPWDTRATQESTEFWQEHALIWGKEEICRGTSTVVPQW